VRDIVLKVNDKYEVIADSFLTDYDRKILTRLYQPIIGFGALSFFFTLWAELEGEQTITTYEKNHSRLVDIMRCNLPLIRQFSCLLEAIGLLKTYKKEINKEVNYIYKLNSPLYPSNFFANEILHILFKKSLSNDEYERTRLYFQKQNTLPKEYEEISANFNEVFSDIDAQHDFKKIMNFKNNSITRVEGKPLLSFDFPQFYRSLQEYQIPKNSITPEIEEEIKILANAYNIGVFDMRNIVIASIDTKNRKIDLSKLKNRCKEHINVDYTSKNTKKESKISFSGNITLDEKIKLFSTITPLEFLQIKYNGKTPLYTDIKLLNDLKKATDLNDSIINVLLDYALLQSNNKLSSAYIYRIAGSLMREGVDDPYEAMLFLNNSKTPKKSSSKKKITEDEVKVIHNELDDADYNKALDDLKKLRESALNKR